jgi:hypothetical protein
MIESHDRDVMIMEEEEMRRNQSFSKLLDFIEDDILTHSELVTKISLAAQDYDGYDFTEDINELLKEGI